VRPDFEEEENRIHLATYRGGSILLNQDKKLKGNPLIF